MRGLRRKGRSAILVMLLAFLLQACSQGPPASTHELPGYPGATGLVDRKLDSNDTLLNIYNSVSFATADSPEVVQKFYRDALLKEGWEIASFQPDPNGLVFRWSSDDQPPASYWVDLTTQARDGGGTEVKVELRYNPGS